MPSPSSSAEFLDLVQKSGLVEDKRLTAYADKLRADNAFPADAKALSAQMIRDGILTHFQAEQILLGKWRRFNIGKYKVLERLGSGGMGSVYLCEHKLMRRRVAVKVLPTAKAADPSALERFYREARAVAALDHPNIVRAYDIDEDDKLHFLVMEHVDGSSLQDIIKKTGPMDYNRAAHYISQAALGLQHAHETAGLVHRDVKPGNVLVDRTGLVKLLDMGLARFFYDEDDILTKKYDENVLGTADYLAPEQATDSHNVDIRADIYSLGATFYYCLTGRTPFAEGTVAQKLIWHQTRMPKPIRGFRNDVPEGLLTVIDRAMAKDMAQRYQLPIEFAEALGPWTQKAIPPPPEDEMPQLSLAAKGASTSGPDSNPVIVRPNTTTDEPPSSRKVWQVPGTPTPRAGPKPAPTQIATPPKGSPSARPATPPKGSPSQRPATPPAVNTPGGGGGAVAPAKRPAAPLAKQQPLANGRARQAAAAAKLAVATADEPDAAVTAATENTAEDKAVSTPRVEAKKKVAPSKPAVSTRVLAGKPPLFWGMVACGVLAALLFVGVMVWSFVHWRNAAAPATTAGAGLPFYVGGSSNLTIEQALARARSHDRIILQGDIEASGVAVKWPDFTIESGPNGPYTWHCPANADPRTPLLNVDNVEGLTVKGIKFDGANKAESLIQLRGRCRDLKLEDLTLTNFKSSGIHVTSAEGTETQPIVFNRLVINHRADSQFGVVFDLDPQLVPKHLNRWFKLTECKSASGKLQFKPAAGVVEHCEPAELFKNLN
jgi:serine/threonine protein kinase